MTEEIMALVREELGCEPPEILSWKLLVKAYIRDEIYKEIKRADGTKGSLYLPPKVIDEDKYRTIVGRVVAIGALCYEDPVFRGRAWCKVGDWVVFTTSDGKLRYHNNHPCYLIEDKLIDYVVPDPNIAIRDK
jgi:co-chaperonin GroES (HSP10)